MNENYLIKLNNELNGQTNLPSFITFESNSNRYSPRGGSSDGLFAHHRVHGYERYPTKEEEEDDSGIQCFMASDSSISTPDIINSVYVNTPGLDCHSREQCQNERQNNLRLKVDFLSPSSFFYKDVNKPSNAVKLSILPKRQHPILYVEKGRIIELTAETNFSPPANSVLKFDIYSIKGTREEPVFGSLNDSISNQSGLSSNLCFVQATEEQKVSAFYLKSEDGFVSMMVPLLENPLSLSIVFPFLNFKCQTSSKKVVFLRISAYNGVIAMASQTFQLVCCTSPNRDFKRHFEKLNSDTCNKVPVKKLKTQSFEESGLTSTGTNLGPSITDNPQYVIMTENYDIWKILNVVHQQLNAHFNSSKK